MPTLKIVLQDAEGYTAAALHAAMRDALVSGQDGVEMRCSINFDEDWAKRGAVIYGRITSAQIWSELRAPMLPKWVMPIGTMNLDNYPDARKLRAAPLKR